MLIAVDSFRPTRVVTFGQKVLSLSYHASVSHLFVGELGGLLFECRVAVLEIFHLFEEPEVENR